VPPSPLVAARTLSDSVRAGVAGEVTDALSEALLSEALEADTVVPGQPPRLTPAAAMAPGGAPLRPGPVLAQGTGGGGGSPTQPASPPLAPRSPTSPFAKPPAAISAVAAYGRDDAFLPTAAGGSPPLAPPTTISPSSALFDECVVSPPPTACPQRQITPTPPFLQPRDGDLYDFNNAARPIAPPRPPPAPFAERKYTLPPPPPPAPAAAWAAEASAYLDEVLGAIGDGPLLGGIFALPPPRGTAPFATADGCEGGGGAPPPAPAPATVLPVSLYLQLERARDAGPHALPADVEALQITHKLLFDVINEELARAEGRFPTVARQLRAARRGGGGAPRPPAALAALQSYFIASLREGLRGTLAALSRNVTEAACEGAEAAARAAALARADVRAGAPGDALEDLHAEQAFIASLVTEDLIAELQEEALEGIE
jgi:hypothetical protein